MSVRIRDDAGLFGPMDTSALKTASVRWPFDLHLLTSSAYPTRAALEARVDRDVDGPNVVAVGIDPTHRWVAVHYGTGTGIRSDTWASIVASGHTDFRAARWWRGVARIGDAASAAREQSRPSIAPPGGAPYGAPSGTDLIAGTVGLLSLSVVLFSVIMLARRSAWLRARRTQRASPPASNGPYRTAAPPETTAAPTHAALPSAPAPISSVVVPLHVGTAYGDGGAAAATASMCAASITACISSSSAGGSSSSF